MNGKKKSSGFLYFIIFLCLAISGTGIYYALSRANTYRASQTGYEALQQQALQTLSEQPSVTPQPDRSTAEPLEEPEGEVVEDDTFLWVLNNSVTPTPLPTASPSPAPTAAPTAAPSGQTASSDEQPAAAPGQSGQSAPSALPTASPTVSPSPTPTVPPYLPSEGISMERSVTVSEAQYTVDFDYLSRVNEDVTGWLYQPEGEINYPIVRGTDNEFYLNHMFDGTVNSNGSIFMDCGNSIAFIDSATYVYGHNTKDGGMFASLGDYQEQSFYQQHPQMLLLTPFADYQVDLFAGIKTTVDDETSWRVKLFDNQKDFDSFADSLIQQSFFTAPDESRPEWGDRLLVLVTCTNVQHGQRFVIYGRMRPIIYQTDETIEASKLMMDERPTQNGYVTIDGVGTFMVYAQNDELWNDLIYETRGSRLYRKFGHGGCGPTAVAMAFANLLDKDKLPTLIGYSNSELGYTFCPCSVNRYFCNHTHAAYQLRTADEFLRYFPLAIANFATGNNIWNLKSRGTGTGTNMRFLEKLCQIYRVGITATRDAAEAMALLQQEDGRRRMAVTCATKGSPFTTTGHYLVIAAVDDQYVYILDPLRDNNYAKNDRKGIVEQLAPGVVRMTIENAQSCNLSPFYILEPYEQ